MHKLNGKKVIFFDMGNTLLYFHNKKKLEKQQQELGIEYLYQYLAEQYPSITKEALIEGFYEPWHRQLTFRKELYKEVAIDGLLNAFLKQYDGYLSYPQCVNAFRALYEPLMELVEVEKETYDILKTLKDHDYQIAVISNTPYFSEVMMECFDMMGLGDCIDQYFFSYDIGIMKPKRDIFEYAMKRMGVVPSECIMVGDSLYQDMAPASQLGMDCIWFNQKEEDNYLEVAIKHECSKLSEILNHLLEADLSDDILLDEVEDEDDEDYYMDSSDLLEEEDDFDISSYIDE